MILLCWLGILQGVCSRLGYAAWLGLLFSIPTWHSHFVLVETIVAFNGDAQCSCDW